MQELHLVGFTTDLEQLIFSVRKGAKSGGYTVSLDEEMLTVIAEAVRMRRAIGGDVGEAASTVEAAVRESSSAGHAKQQSALTPREIQVRLRAGRSVKQVARAAGVTEAWVERFAAPVRGEQSQIAAKARSMVFSKPRLGESAEPLGLSVRWSIAERGVRFTELEFDERWSAYQFQDHLWVVSFTFESRKREQRAEWVLDLEAGEVLHRNRLASDLGYLEPGKRRKVQDLVPEPASPSADADADDSDDAPSRRPAVKRVATAGPSKKARAKKSAAKKSAAKKSTAKKAKAKTAAAKKAAAKKAVAKKAAAKKAVAKKAAAKKAVAKKSRAKKSAGKKAAPKKSRAKKPAGKKPAGKKAAAKKSATKKASPRKAAARKTARSSSPAARRSGQAGTRPPAAERRTNSSPWRSLSAGTTIPTPRTPTRPSSAGPPERRAGTRTKAGTSRSEAVTAKPPEPQPAQPKIVARRVTPEGIAGPGSGTVRPVVAADRDAAAESSGSLAEAPANQSSERLARRAARRARIESTDGASTTTNDGGQPDADGALPNADPGQVVTIRANRATPPLADRSPRSEQAAPQEVDGVASDDDTPALRPATQARPPRRRYGRRT